jgi:hypothetical protein
MTPREWVTVALCLASACLTLWLVLDAFTRWLLRRWPLPVEADWPTWPDAEAWVRNVEPVSPETQRRILDNWTKYTQAQWAMWHAAAQEPVSSSSWVLPPEVAPAFTRPTVDGNEP